MCASYIHAMMPPAVHGGIIANAILHACISCHVQDLSTHVQDAYMTSEQQNEMFLWCVQVIGLACFKALSADGVSFAIPIDTAKDVIEQLQQRGRVIRPFIGIKMLQLTEHNAAQMRQQDANFPEITQGILVPHVAAGSPACKCGVREGDIITGEKILSAKLYDMGSCLSKSCQSIKETTA